MFYNVLVILKVKKNVRSGIKKILVGLRKNTKFL
jgi:hypothetical protein